MFKKVVIVGGIVLVIGLVVGWKHIGAFMDGRVTTVNEKTVRFVLDKNKTIDELGIELKDKKISLYSVIVLDKDHHS